jgi:hypothetical protein
MRTQKVMIDDEPVTPFADGSVSIDLDQDRVLTVLYD